MVRATLRGLQFVADAKNKNASLDIIMKNWRVENRALAAEMYKYMAKAMSPDASISMQGLQYLVDRQRENAKVTAPIDASRVIDFSFVNKARKDLGIAR